MRFEQKYSNSAGNLYVVTASNGKRLLLECGVPWKKVQKALGYDLSGIAACLLTHCHGDHAKSVKDVMRAGIDVYMSEGTHTALGLTKVRRAIVCKHFTPFHIGKDFGVYPFNVNHDAPETFGFLISAEAKHTMFGGETMLFAPDTSHINQRFKTAFSIIAIECSFDKDILTRRVEDGSCDETLAKRLLTSHMEKSVTMRYLAEFCDLSKCRQLHLLHLSQDNIDRETVRAEFQEKFQIETFIAGAATECPNTTE